MLSFWTIDRFRLRLYGLLVMLLTLPTYTVAVISKGTGGVVVPTQYGRVLGDIEGHVLAFRGIRFAAPPTGPLRFHPPMPPKVWSEIQPALDFAPACPQLVS